MERHGYFAPGFGFSLKILSNQKIFFFFLLTGCMYTSFQTIVRLQIAYYENKGCHEASGKMLA